MLVEAGKFKLTRPVVDNFGASGVNGWLVEFE
jgi:hypothetical protein